MHKNNSKGEIQADGKRQQVALFLRPEQGHVVSKVLFEVSQVFTET